MLSSIVEAFVAFVLLLLAGALWTSCPVASVIFVAIAFALVAPGED